MALQFAHEQHRNVHVLPPGKKLKYVSGDRMEGPTVTTVMILSFRTDRSGQTLQTQIRLLISV